ncbi:MAG: universal stress protein [Syntrophomonadaceae bacterium]|nr:universal stress protein [Syntrophomonadaceae bacterium]MDD3888294.1 universal stress protein [Syntrophomonadaceae bacterium]MDD4548801.1 universal stress protein [Syntrophomonadaceae bacterium]
MAGTMFNKVLLPVDASEQSNRAVLKAAELAKAGMIGNIILFNVYDSSDVDITKLHNSDKLDELRAKSLVLLKQYQNILKENQIECQLKRAGGDPAALILDVVENDKEFDLIILGSRKLNKFKELVLGSVTDKVTRLVDIPVFIVK